MNIRSSLATCAFDIAYRICLSSSASVKPGFTVTPKYHDYHNSTYTLYNPAGEFAGFMGVVTGDKPYVTMQGVPIYNSFQEVFYIGANGKYAASILYRDRCYPSGIREEQVPTNTLFQLWRRANISVASLIREDGAPDNQAVGRALYKISAAYNKIPFFEVCITQLLKPPAKFHHPQSTPAVR